MELIGKRVQHKVDAEYIGQVTEKFEWTGVRSNYSDAFLSNLYWVQWDPMRPWGHSFRSFHPASDLEVIADE